MLESAASYKSKPELLTAILSANGYAIEHGLIWRADLRGLDLSRTDLRMADLREVDLRVAVLSRAWLVGADLSGANLSGADLSEACLSHANLRGADLSIARTQGACLYGADLQGANLHGADLCGLDMRGLRNFGTHPSHSLAAAATFVAPPEGPVIGWKKCWDGVIVKLLIPASAKRSNATSRKCRAEFAEVLEVHGGTFGISVADCRTEYHVGQTVMCDIWCENRWEECAGGIHFFITREEAEAYQL